MFDDSNRGKHCTKCLASIGSIQQHAIHDSRCSYCKPASRFMELVCPGTRHHRSLANAVEMHTYAAAGADASFLVL